MKQTPFIGLGTGRCGTNSLVHILNSCKNVDVTKTDSPVPWYGPPSKGLIVRLASGYGEKLVGDVSEFLLPHVYALRKTHTKLKVVCLHRPMKETVDSMVKWVRPMHRPIEQLQNRNNKWVQMYPVIDAATQRQAFEFFWQMYETESRAIDGDVLHLNTEDLNDTEALIGLFDFLSVPLDDRVFPEVRRVDPFRDEQEAKGWMGNVEEEVPVG